MEWAAICQMLKEATHEVVAAADWEALGRQLLAGPQQRADREPELVTEKVSRLCQRLMACRVRYQQSAHAQVLGLSRAHPSRPCSKSVCACLSAATLLDIVTLRGSMAWPLALSRHT